MLVFFGLRKLACALKAGALLPHSKVIEERAFESVRDKFSHFIVLEPKSLSFPRKRESRKAWKDWIPAGVYPVLDTGQE